MHRKMRFWGHGAYKEKTILVYFSYRHLGIESNSNGLNEIDTILFAEEVNKGMTMDYSVEYSPSGLVWDSCRRRRLCTELGHNPKRPSAPLVERPSHPGIQLLILPCANQSPVLP